jgi:hypothetical protein
MVENIPFLFLVAHDIGNPEVFGRCPLLLTADWGGSALPDPIRPVMQIVLGQSFRMQ